MDPLNAHLDRGWDLISRGDLSGALLSAQKSLEIDDKSAEAHNLLGYVRAAEGDTEQALHHYKRAIDLDESFIEAMLNAAEVLIHPYHDFDGALDLIEDALEFAESEDEIADALLIKFEAYLHQGDKENAGKVAKLFPKGPFENPQLDFMLARARFDVGNLDEAEPHLREAVSKFRDNPDVHYYYGMLLEARGDRAGANMAFLDCREIDLGMPRPPWALSTDAFRNVVESARKRLVAAHGEAAGNSTFIISDAPGAEVVLKNVNPRTELWVDDEKRMFIYQRSIERGATNPLELEDVLLSAIEQELGFESTVSTSES